MHDAERFLAKLNEPQRAAVSHGDGPLLILAGAGSGKTRVITHRIAFLIGVCGVLPREIVAVTFTNKSAAEMKERVEKRLGHAITGAFIGTFHAFGLRLLRANALAAGYPPSFVIYDTTDQLAVMRAVLKELSIDDKAFPPRQVLSWISRTKNELIAPDEATSKARFPHEKVMARCYKAYEESLKRVAAVDFDDLLVKVVRLLRANPEIAERYARRIRYLLVDEYQDTNPMQYALIRLLSKEHRNVCCVGDEDQSIYAFRGADIRNILDFTRDHPDATIVKLEQNYRSSKRIIKAAAAVIGNNEERHEKTLWTDNPEGAKLVWHEVTDDRKEADLVVRQLVATSSERGVPLEECAILYRTNATSRLFEDRLAARNIPYRIVGSLRFYDRKEIKDLLAWVRLIVHPDSDQDFHRACSTPPRGIGAKTLEVLATIAREKGSSLHAALEHALAGDALSGRAHKALASFAETLADLRELVAQVTTAATLTSIIEAIDYAAHLEKAHPADHASRAENLDALVSAAEEHDEAGAPDGLAGFLDRVSLRSDTDDVQGARGPSLMTVHAAKGLEFDVVFLVGMNKDLFPHARAQADPKGLEEERRLMYVAMTRARKHLTLTSAQFRRQYGEPIVSDPSLFLAEIPEEFLDSHRAAPDPLALDAPVGGAYGGWSGRSGGSRGARVTHAGGRSAATRPSKPAPAAGTARRSGQVRVERDPGASASDGDCPFSKGMTLRHPAFGRGTVLSVSGSGDRLTLEIRFEKAGLKRIMPRYVTLLPDE